MADNSTRVLNRTIDHEMLKEIYSSDQEMYPGPLSFERLQDWVLNCPDLAVHFYVDPNGGHASTSLGAIIVLPILKGFWEQLLVGQAKEPSVDTSMFPLQNSDIAQDVGLHVFHIEKFSDIKAFGKDGRFSTFSLNHIREISSKKRWNILGYSGSTPSTKCLALSLQQSFTNRGNSAYGYDCWK